MTSLPSQLNEFCYDVMSRLRIVHSEWEASKLKSQTIPVTSHMSWGKPVETIKQSAFLDEVAFKSYIDDAKNFPSGTHPHRIYSNGIYKCNHVAVDGVACEHYTKTVIKVVGTGNVAEVYAFGKHAASATLFDCKSDLPKHDLLRGLETFIVHPSAIQQCIADQLFAMTCDPTSKSSIHAVMALSDIVTYCGLMSVIGTRLLQIIRNEVTSTAVMGTLYSTNSSPNTIGALNMLYALLSNFGSAMEPFTVPLLSNLLALHADRVGPVRNLATRCAQKLFGCLCPYVFFSVFPQLAAAIGGSIDTYANIDWRVKVGSLNLLTAFATGSGDSPAPSASTTTGAAAAAGSGTTPMPSARVSRAINQISSLLPQLVPLISECMLDSKRQVQLAGIDAMHAVCKAITNDDIRHLVPQLVTVIAKPEEASATLDKLMETTFVSNVDAATLSLLSPLLVKTLKGRSSVFKRKAGKVIINMCKLGQDSRDVLLLVTTLLPVLDKAIDEIVEAEVLQVLRDARQTMLLKAVGHKVAANTTTTTVATAVVGEINEEEVRRMEAVAAQATAAAAASKLSQNMDVPLDKVQFAAMTTYFDEKLVQLTAEQEQIAQDNTAAAAVPLDIAALSVSDATDNVVSPSAAGVLQPKAQAAMVTAVRRYVSEACALFLLTTSNAPSVAAAAVGDSKSTGEVDLTAQRTAISERVARSSIMDWNRCVAPFIRDAMGYVLEDSNCCNNNNHSTATVQAVTAALSAAAHGSSDSNDSSVPATITAEGAKGNAGKYSRSRGNSTIRSRANSTLSQNDGLPSVSYLCALFRAAVLAGTPDCDQEPDDEDADLCNIEFSLAYGGKILLHNTHLRLGRGRRYGLMGKNGAGKTTLLVNIGNGHIEGLPSSLRTVYVQHDDASDDHGVSMLNELMDSKEMKALTSLDESSEYFVTRKDAATALRAVGFTKEMLTAPRSALSGGWKMKLLIVKAMLSKPNVLLLDEPTNHLDMAAVAWLVNYLQSTPDLTCIIVSHDTKFLDDVVTDIIHYEQLKLVYYRGNMTNFVEIKPEAKYYYDLSGDTLSFRFPLPERLDGVNSLSRAVLKVDNVTYTYPGCSTPTLRKASAKVSLGSRVAVTGANGAGKSTLIKLLVQEVEQDAPTEENGTGEVYKHHNLRVAYVAQHSFHHLEQSLDITPVDYIKQRFYGGVDKEDLSRQNMKLSEEEVSQVAEKKYGEVDCILGRRKNGHTMEYECTFIGQTARDPNKYIAREKLIEFGLIKLVNQCDTKVAAAAAGLAVRPLLTAEIQGHLDDFNLESEFGTHGSIRRLSGGQKVKLVLAAAMWNKPHVLILDEPTNYLDRQALGALTQAIKTFSGGVVIISHNSEFTDAVCNETWLVKDGVVYTKGGIDSSVITASADGSVTGVTSDGVDSVAGVAAVTAVPDSSNSLKKSRKEHKLAEGSSSIKKSGSSSALNNGSSLMSPATDSSGNLNKTIVSKELLNPKTLEVLSKKELRKLERLANVAGVSLPEYVSKIKFGSPEWNWL